MVEYIEYNNEKIPVRISKYALTMLKKETGKTFDEIINENDLELYDVMIYHSIVSGYKAEGKELPFTREDAEWFNISEDIFWKFIEVLPKFIPQLEDQGLVKKKTLPENRNQRRQAARQIKKTRK